MLLRQTLHINISSDSHCYGERCKFPVTYVVNSIWSVYVCIYT